VSLRHYKKSKIKSIDGRLNDELHLMLSGFGQQTLIPVEEILKNINRLPDSHISGLRTIEYDPKRENLLPNIITRFFQKAPKCCKGVFMQKKRKIVMYEFNSKPMFFHILFHEIGHFVYFLTISPQLKKQWVATLHKIKPFVTPLSKRNAAEDFAECYSLYITDPSLLKQAPQKYDFIHQYVFGNDLETENDSHYFDGIALDKTY
jgi:hypothetical protein